ncbi:alpha-glucosidase [Salsuginibacillus halophilus]|uniref:Alpha-glucosidase n=1 Tax=Salsuginibacillus halophilus TaxID=517424 RepID=A0A2P8HL03_9BACI|nr:alpha-glucosidase [Salsuginibacillus halophilus]PSL46886.1 alpha-glucosidase [Salsuginibacillus halophilus]
MTSAWKNRVQFNESSGGELELWFDERLILKHESSSPMIYLGVGHESVEMYRGNFDIEDYLEERVALRHIEWEETAESVNLHLKPYAGSSFTLQASIQLYNDQLRIDFTPSEPVYNRFWLRVSASEEEAVYGCGEQLSYFNMRGQNFPLWTSEPGVGRNKSTYTTFLADVKDRAGGDYYNTNYPQPTFISTEKYICHVATTAYAEFNFKNQAWHELQAWEIPEAVWFETGESYKDLTERVTEHFGRPPELPDWTYEGIWLGVQGGTDQVQHKLDRARQKGLKVGALWCQDWQGKRVTSFGKRLMWNWKWNPEMYPGLDEKVKEWKSEGVRFLGYINPYVAIDGDLYEEASQKGYVALTADGHDYIVDFGEFYCGVVDFTNPAAYEWYKSVIKDEMIDFGMDGWMADFGEYLPSDVHLYNGESAMIMHNAWPAIWAKVNHDAVKEAGRWGDIVYFMRAGFTGIQGTCPLLWAGDQSVNWSMDDGLASVIPGALSAGMSGCGLHHSDIGGYTSLHGNKRPKELLLRWLDMAVFTPVIRTHEGNRPDDCFQFDDDEESLEHFVDMTNIYTALAPYTKAVVQETAERGIPAQRPLFMEYEADEVAYQLQYEYMYGPDLLVAPVHDENVQDWTVYLPEDKWVHLWTGKAYEGAGEVTVEAPIGQPPVFYRAESAYASLFASLPKQKVYSS